MGFLLYKLLGQLIRPLPLCLLVAALALLLPWPRPARLISASSLTLLALLSLPATGLTLLRRLEPPLQLQAIRSLEPADVVVVLAGVFPDAELCGLELMRLQKGRQLLFSGTLGAMERQRLRNLLALTRLPAALLLEETDSRTTAEGGRAFRRLAAEHGWRSAHLVSGSFHLPRALRHYQSEGVRLTPVACPELRLPTAAARARRPLPQRALDWIPSVEGLRWSSSALKELLGRGLAP